METIGLFGGILLFSVLCLLPEVKAQQYDPFRANEIMNRGILQQQTIMYSSFFMRELQYDPFRAEEIINRGILQQQTIFHYKNSFNG